MLTPEQISKRLVRAREAWDEGDEQWVGDLFDLLEHVLPAMGTPACLEDCPSHRGGMCDCGGESLTRKTAGRGDS